MTDRPLSEDPIFKHLQEQDKFYRENPRDEAITGKVGWEESWERTEAPRTELVIED